MYKSMIINECMWIYASYLLMKTTHKLALAGKEINTFRCDMMMIYGNQGTLICLTISNNTLNVSLFFSTPNWDE